MTLEMGPSGSRLLKCQPRNLVAPPMRDHPEGGSDTVTAWPVPAESATVSDPPAAVGSPLDPRSEGTIRLAAASALDTERNATRRASGLVGGVLRSRRLRGAVSTRVAGGRVGLVVVAGGAVVVVLLVVVVVDVVVVTVVVETPGLLAGCAGSVPASSSVRSKKPSSSRSTPMRVPVPGGTAV